MALFVVLVGALASLVAAAVRFHYERASYRVELSMDQQDLADFTSAYGYDMDGLLRLMKAAGLTSLAVYEELGNRINLGNDAYEETGQQIIDAARTSALIDPLLTKLVKANAIDSGAVYILVFDRQTLKRYILILRNQLEPRNVVLLRDLPRGKTRDYTAPALLEVRTQIDYFNNLGLGIPAESVDQAHRLGLLVDPRVQNNERLDQDHIDVVFKQMLAGDTIGTVIFFGLRNEVLGYPFNLDGTADAFRTYQDQFQPLFGNVEAYDPTQFQKGGDTLGRKIPGLTVRVEAISRLELDKLDLDTVVARYILGVRERNIRVVYLRPFPHLAQVRQRDGTYRTMSAQETNLEMLHRLRDGLVANGFYLGRPSTIPDFGGLWLDVLYCLAALGVSAAFLIALELYGWSRPWFDWTAYAFTLVAFWGLRFIGHDDITRRVWALGGALTFAVLAGTTIARYFNERATLWPGAPPLERPGGSAGAEALAGLRCLLVAVGVALLGSLFVVGLLAQASFMLEVQQFFGVKALLVVPPILLLVLYAFSPLWGNATSLRDAGAAPVRVWQMLAVFVLAAGAVLLLMRSGNLPDVSVSDFELHLRGFLTTLLGARPRFKEFLIGFPALVLLPALAPQHRRVVGWIIVIAAGIGVSDVLDTFSHVHTALLISVLRLFNGVVAGAIVGFVAQWIYRRLRPMLSAPQAR
ncbi:MAG: hypothetical protein JO194_06895 [Candidatus Eremiobacteraeota bacterium]|nr:hypothetical protein [Candidatus Eremiobacteraeota bacterium]